MAISNDPNDPHFGLETDTASPNFGLPSTEAPAAPQRVPSQPQTSGFGAFMRGLDLPSIPRDVGKTLTEALFPQIQAVHAIHQAVDVARGVPVEQAIPESQQLVGIEKKPLEERIKTGANIAMSLAFAKSVGGGLTESLFGKPSVPAEPAAPLTERAVAEATKFQPLVDELHGLIDQGDALQSKGQPIPTELIQRMSQLDRYLTSQGVKPQPRGGEVSATKPISEAGTVPIEQGKPAEPQAAVQAQEGDTRQASTQGQEIGVTKEVASYDAETHDRAMANVDARLAGQPQPSKGELFRLYDEEYNKIKGGGAGEKEVQKDEGQGERRDGVLSEPAAGETPPSPAAAVPAKIVSTAVKEGDQIITGNRFNQAHEQFSKGAAEENKGFLVEDTDGTQRFAGRDEAARIAKESGQVASTHEGPLHSEALIEAPKGASARQIPTATEPIRVRPITALKNVYQAAEKAGTAGYKRGLTEARTEGKAAAAQIKGELSVADKWLAGDQEQVRQNMVDYVNKTLTPAERGRFVGAITRALRRPALQGGDPSVMYKNAFNVMKAIENRSEQVYKGGVIDDIKSTLTKSLESKSVDVQYRRGVKDFLDQISFTKPTKGTVSRLQSLRDFVEKERVAGREPSVPKEQLEQLSTLSKLPLQDMPTNALEKMRDEVENFVSLGKVKAKLQERAWTRSRESAIKELRASPSSPIETRPMYQPQPTERLTIGQKFMNVVKGTLNARLNFENAIAPMDEIYDHMDGARGTYDGWASKNIKGRLDLDRNKTISEWLPIKQQSDALIKKYGLKTADMQTVQIKGIIKMVGRERLEAMGVRPDIIDRLDKTPLTEGQQVYHDFIRKQYDAVGTRIQDVAHRLYQQDMQIVPDYMPLERDWAANAEREPPEPMADPSIGQIPFNETATMNQLLRDVNPKILSRTEQGFLKDRLEGAKTAVKLDANEVFERHMQDALHFVNSQGNLKMLGEIVRRPEFEKKFGKTGQNIVLDHLDTVANQGYVNHMQRVRWLDWVRNSTSKGAIGFRVASNFVHTSQLPIAAYHAGGAGWWSKGLQLALSEKGQNWLRQNAAETYVRGGGEPAQVEVEAFSKFGRAGFFVARNIDKINAQATLLGRYAKEMQKSGVSVDNVLDAPVNPDLQGLALRRMHRAVASPQSKDIPQMTSRGAFVGGNVSVARALNQFRNIFLDNWSNVRHDMLRVGAGDADRIVNHLRAGEIAAGAKEVGDAGSHRAAIAAAMLMSVALETGIKLGTKKGIQAGMTAATGIEPAAQRKGAPEETYLGDLQHHLINRVPFVGQLYTAAVYGETGVPTIDAILAPLHEAGQVVKSKTPETQAKHVVRAASAAGTVLGIPGTSQALEAGGPAISKAIAPLIPDRSKGKVARGSKEPILMK